MMISGIGHHPLDCLMQALDRAAAATEDVAALSEASKRTDVMGFLDDVLDLSAGRSPIAALNDLSSEDAEGALQALARLLKAGVVGYEYRKVNGEVRKVFIDAAIGSDLHRAPLVKDHEIDRYA